MTPADKNEKRYTEDLDRLLRGEEPLEDRTDTDHAQMLQFSRRLQQLGEEPRPEFAGQLKHRLVVELAAQDAQAKFADSWFVRLFSWPKLRLAVVSTFIVLAAVGLVWRAGMLSPTMTDEDSQPGIMMLPEDSMDRDAPPPRAPDAPSAALHIGPLTIEGHAPPVVGPEEAVNITIVFSYDGPDALVLMPFPPAIHIREAETGRIVYTFEQGTSRHTLEPMSPFEYELEPWNQQDNRGVQVGFGSYAVDVAIQEITPDGESERWPMEMVIVTTFDISPQDPCGLIRDSGNTG